MQHHIAAVTTTVAGAQDGAVDARFADSENRHIQVQVGPAWVTCFDPQAILSHMEGWNAARDTLDWLPAEFDGRQGDPRMIGSAIIRARGPVRPAIYEARDDNAPYVEVRVGTLRTRAYDQAAVTSIADTWNRAASLAMALWRPRADMIDSPAVAEMIHRTGTKAIRHRGLPPKA